ncbi:MAG: aminopeptidase [Bacillota bacterium]
MQQDLTARLQAGALVAVSQCLSVQQGETVLIVTDQHCLDVAWALWRAAWKVRGEPMMMVMRPREAHGEEPPLPVAKAMKESAVCLLPTSRSLTHTVARREASEAGTRLASMPGITSDIAARSLDADYGQISCVTEKVASLLDAGASVQLETPAGTHLTMDISGRRAVRDTGLYTSPGAFGNLPAGEAYIAPVEGSATGHMVVDSTMAGIGFLDHPLVIEVVEGKAVSVTGRGYAERLEAMLDAAGPAARNLAELGIGTNPAATIVGNVLEDEKVLGTVHVALGSNASFGGRVRVACHLDGVMLRPSLWVDGVLVMESGMLLA